MKSAAGTRARNRGSRSLGLRIPGGLQKPVEIGSLQQSSIEDNRADALRLGDVGKGIAIEQQKIGAFANGD